MTTWGQRTLASRAGTKSASSESFLQEETREQTAPQPIRFKAQSGKHLDWSVFTNLKSRNQDQFAHKTFNIEEVDCSFILQGHRMCAAHCGFSSPTPSLALFPHLLVIHRRGRGGLELSSLDLLQVPSHCGGFQGHCHLARSGDPLTSFSVFLHLFVQAH